MNSRSPHGERGLKFFCWGFQPGAGSRSPHGERGLKSIRVSMMVSKIPRRSPHGERGLKFHGHLIIGGNGESLPSRGAWIEIFGKKLKHIWTPSLPSRGAWIEIGPIAPCTAVDLVAPLTGSVD